MVCDSVCGVEWIGMEGDVWEPGNPWAGAGKFGAGLLVGVDGDGMREDGGEREEDGRRDHQAEQRADRDLNIRKGKVASTIEAILQ